MEFSDIALDLDHLTLRGLRSGRGNKNKVLCLHGWLDNANSFAPVIPLIHDSDVVAIDLAGHGHSDHLSEPYTLVHHAHYTLQAANALQWDEFHLLGHSLGGCIAPFAAVACKDKIKSVISIDAVGPQTETADQLPARLARFHHDLLTYNDYRSRLFENIEQAVDSRLRANKMTEESARLIVERQLIETPDGFRWRFDGKLRAASASYFTESQVMAVLAEVACPVQCILADNGYIVNQKHLQQRLNQIKNLDLVTVAGHHHVHTDNPQIVAAEVNRFLASLYPGVA